MTNLQTNTSLAASQNLNLFEVVLVWTTKNKYSLPRFQYFVTKREKFNSSQDAELWLWTTLCTEAAIGNFQDKSSSSFRREVESRQTLSWIYFNWWGKGENTYFKYFWINVLKNEIYACSKQSFSWQTPAMPQALKSTGLKEMGSKDKPRYSTVTLDWHSPCLSSPGTAPQTDPQQSLSSNTICKAQLHWERNPMLPVKTTEASLEV